MKRKLAIGILTGAIILGGAGTYAYAQTNEDGVFNFKQMKPFMEKMHPNLSPEELEEMNNACHGKGGMMENGHMKGMMNHL